MARRGEGGIYLIITPTLILPHQGGGKFFRELDAPQLPLGRRLLRGTSFLPFLKGGQEGLIFESIRKNKPKAWLDSQEIWL
jgi:hypothetical protein